MRPLVVIPAYNLEESVPRVIESVVGKGIEVLVVDDGSSDATAPAALNAGAHVIRSPQNEGKGAALVSGFRWAVAAGFDPIVTMDGDGQHSPEDLPAFLRAFEEGNRFVIGNRMGDPQGMPWMRRQTNRVMSAVLGWLLRVRAPDSQCGFRLMAREVIDGMRLSSRRYEIDSEILLRASQRGFLPRAVPIRSIYSGQPSRIRPFRDTARFLRFLLKEVCAR